MSQTLTDILVVIAAVFLVWLVIRLFRKPIRWILKLLLNTAIGFAALFLLNFFGSAIGITLGLNWINALVIGGAGAAAAHQISLLAYINVSPHPKMRGTALSGRAGALRQLRPCTGGVVIVARERPSVRRGERDVLRVHGCFCERIAKIMPRIGLVARVPRRKEGRLLRLCVAFEREHKLACLEHGGPVGILRHAGGAVLRAS